MYACTLFCQCVRRLKELRPFSLVKGGDVIVRLGEGAATGLEDFDSALRKHKAGETISVVVMRDGAEVTLQITLDPPK